jgi:hypothetical protein
MPFAEALRGRTEEQQQPETQQVAVAGSATMEPSVPAALPQYEQQTTGQSIRSPDVNSLHLLKMLKIVLAEVEQTMKEFNSTVIEEYKIVVITKIVLNIMRKTTTRFHGHDLLY